MNPRGWPPKACPDCVLAGHRQAQPGFPFRAGWRHPVLITRHSPVATVGGSFLRSRRWRPRSDCRRSLQAMLGCSPARRLSIGCSYSPYRMTSPPSHAALQSRRERGPHARFIVSRDVADKKIAAGLEANGECAGLAGGEQRPPRGRLQPLRRRAGHQHYRAATFPGSFTSTTIISWMVSLESLVTLKVTSRPARC